MLLRSTFAQRILFGLVMIVVLIGLIFLDGWFSVSGGAISDNNKSGILVALLAAALAGGGCVELGRLFRARQINPSLIPMQISVILVSLGPYWTVYITPSPLGGLALALVFSMLAAGLYQGIKYQNEGALLNLAVSGFAGLYLGGGCWFLISIRLFGCHGETVWGQVGYLLVFLACVKSADIGAYFTGRFLGRHKWVPSISPGKTWEGFFGGIVGAGIVASLFSAFSDIISIGTALWFGPVVAVTGQMGDLLESMLKRDAGVKDSARLIPEFGGILDLLDSVVVSAPFAWLILSKLGPPGQ